MYIIIHLCHCFDTMMSVRCTGVFVVIVVLHRLMIPDMCSCWTVTAENNAQNCQYFKRSIPPIKYYV